jgi:hypothetical protein
MVCLSFRREVAPRWLIPFTPSEREELNGNALYLALPRRFRIPPHVKGYQEEQHME